MLRPGFKSYLESDMCEWMQHLRDYFAFLEGIPPLISLLNSENPEVKESVTLAVANMTTANNTNCRYSNSIKDIFVFVSSVLFCHKPGAIFSQIDLRYKYVVWK